MGELDLGVEDPSSDPEVPLHQLSSMLKPAFAVSWWLLPALEKM